MKIREYRFKRNICSKQHLRFEMFDIPIVIQVVNANFNDIAVKRTFQINISMKFIIISILVKKHQNVYVSSIQYFA